MRFVTDILQGLKQRFHLAALRRGQTIKELTSEVLSNRLKEQEPEVEIKQGRETDQSPTLIQGQLLG